ncbi:class I adenylate-forming enzyme family protein [Streptomyces tateyamensis]|uniref:class I adenylate-forming enzyme family protein n=1 Tax=Streptomyces tateyamensis TaxID=565073 RepID=UPI001C64DA7B|nr:fatty acid--CoA ligase family protein [Streptomyces tateyamensis]
MAGWVDHYLLSGDPAEPCLHLGEPVNRHHLRRLVDDRRQQLAAVGLTAGGTVALRLPPSLDYVTTLLAAWRLGAQVALLDHRLTLAETERALHRLRPQYLIGPESVEPLTDGQPATSAHVLVQLSSGSTGPSKVIARTSADLVRELDCYRQLAHYPGRGERIVLLASMVHVLGLVGGLLHSLRSGLELVVPQRLTPPGILAAVRAAEVPTTLLGVPFYAELLARMAQPPPTPQLVRMIVAGELVRPSVPAAFAARYGVPLGTMYGMTEIGVIATDLTGELYPSVRPVAGMRAELIDGELHLAQPESPYLGLTDPGRWSDGLLHTRDAADLDRTTGLITVRGRQDSQVSIGGLKVDLTEVEQTLAALPGVREAVVAFADGAIEAYAAADTTAELLRAELAGQLAGYKLPRRLTLLPALPRTATGKVLRDAQALRAAAAAVHPS